MYKDKYPEIRDRVKKVLGRTGSTEIAYHFTWMIRRYFHYAFLALANGYQINVRWAGKIKLVHETPKKYQKWDELRYFQSDKLYGYMFSVEMELKTPITCQFYPDEPFRSILKESIGSDNIYTLVKS